MDQDENSGRGGSYVIQDDKRVLVERTEDHPDGNGPRESQTLAAPVKPPVGKNKPAPEADSAPATTEEGAK